MQAARKQPLTAAEMLSQIKKDELDRVNRKFGKQSSNVNGDDTMLQKTTNLLDEAEALLAGGNPGEDDSNLLQSPAQVD